jgi:hypothetical protein
MHTVFGIRHHGPGSAKSLAAAFAVEPPDALVIEAPEELGSMLSWLDHEDLAPPVAALLWASDDPKKASFFPLAVFSPEWVAMRWAKANGVPIYCMDLPMRHSLALRMPPRQPIVEVAPAGEPEQDSEETPAVSLAEGAPKMDIDVRDPISALAHAAGYDDGEAWWEHLVEAQGHAAFEAITEAMAAAREAGIGRLDDETLRREAQMRQVLRTAIKDGHSRIAVVCGAYHAPVLTAEALKSHAIKDDAARLKSLPKVKTEVTWVPWATSKFAASSGYGAGVEAPGWYAHLFESAQPADIATGWLAKTAQALRAEDIDAPAASVIEAVRLAEALATMRRRHSPDLSELREASLAVLCHGESLTLRLAEERLLGRSSRFDVLGRVPDTLPQSPLQVDFAAQNRSLRLKTEALDRMVELDLRQEHDRSRSQHLWRLGLLGVSWATVQEATRGKGSFRETWRLRWQPESALALIEAGRYGGTLAEAAHSKVLARLELRADLPALLALADEVLKAALVDDLAVVLRALDARAAVASDVGELMSTLPPLTALVRYGDVRRTDAEGMRTLLQGVLTRTCVGMPNACAQLNPDAASAFVKSLDATHAGLQTLADEALLEEWLSALQVLAAATTTPALIAGRSVRLLLDAARLEIDDASRRLSLALSPILAPVDAANWLEGFLRGSVHVLLGSAELRNLIGAWLSALSADDFQTVLPLARRSFSVFAAAERKLLLQEVRQRDRDVARSDGIEQDYDPAALEIVRVGLRAWLPQ